MDEGTTPPVTPLPVPADARLVLLFGGTFDPPHRAHAELPARVRDELERRMGCEGRGWVVYVPAARSPLKGAGPRVGDEDRAAMLELAIAGVARMSVWTDELDRARAAPEEGGASYTIDTVRRARAEMERLGMLGGEGGGGAVLRLLIGGDQAADFHLWKNYRELIELAEPVVMVRGSWRGAASFVVERMKELGPWTEGDLRAWRERVMDVGAMRISATDARQLLARHGPDDARVGELLSPAVLAYIKHKGLYRGEAL